MRWFSKAERAELSDALERGESVREFAHGRGGHRRRSDPAPRRLHLPARCNRTSGPTPAITHSHEAH